MPAVIFDGALSPTIAIGECFVGNATVVEALYQVCHATLEALPDVTMTGIAMMVNAKVGTYVFTDVAVAEIDSHQHRTGRGPCVDVFRTGEAIRIGSTQARGPYPEFCRAAAERHVRSVLSLPLSMDGRLLGVLNLYSPIDDAYQWIDTEIARSFAANAALALSNQQAYRDAYNVSGNVRYAIESRAKIEQAKGIIMATTGCTAAEAFTELRQQSQYRNVKVSQIATEFIECTQRARRRRTDPPSPEVHRVDR